MACSLSCGNTDVTCYVLHGDRLFPLCVSASTRLIDLGSVLQKSNVPENVEDTDNKPLAPRTVILINGLNSEGSQTTIENVRILHGQPFDGSNSGDKTNTVEAEGAFSDVHLTGEDHSGNHLSEVTRLKLQGCFLYTYMRWTFQWIEPSETGSYSRTLHAMFFEIMRAAIALSLWAVMGFELFNLINGLPALLARTNTFTSIVAVMHRLLWTLRYVILHHAGLYFFQAHREHINDILNNSNGISDLQWQKSHRLIQDLLAVTAFFLLLLPLLQKLIPIFIEQANGIPRNWDMNVEIVEFVVLLYSRIVAMPVFFFLILVVHVHILELENFNEQIQQSDRTITELLKKYKALTKRIQNSSQAFQPYIIALLLLLVLWGTISVYSGVEMFEHIPPKQSIVFGVSLSECLGTFLVFICETVFLFSLPLYKLGQVSSQLSRLIYTVTTLDCEQQRQSGFTFNSEKKLALFASLLESHQRYGNVGFRVAGLQLTQLKSLWLTLLGPVIAFVGNLLIKEHF